MFASPLCGVEIPSCNFFLGILITDIDLMDISMNDFFVLYSWLGYFAVLNSSHFILKHKRIPNL